MIKKYATARLQIRDVISPSNPAENKKFAHIPDLPEGFTPIPGKLYARLRAISNRCNENYDYWSRDELYGKYDNHPAGNDKYGYRTFIGKPNFVDHVNHATADPRGRIVHSWIHSDPITEETIPRMAFTEAEDDDTWVELLVEVDADRWPVTAEAINKGELFKVSMGCDISYSKCSVCGKEAQFPSQYCTHISHHKGEKFTCDWGKMAGQSVVAYEINHGTQFFEISWITTEQADPTAIANQVFAVRDEKPKNENIIKLEERGNQPIKDWQEERGRMAKAAMKTMRPNVKKKAYSREDFPMEVVVTGDSVGVVKGLTGRAEGPFDMPMGSSINVYWSNGETGSYPSDNFLKILGNGIEKVGKKTAEEDLEEMDHVRECPVRKEDVNIELCVNCIYSEVEVDDADGRYAVECKNPNQTKEIGFDPNITFEAPVDGGSLKKKEDDKDKKKDKKKDEKKKSFKRQSGTVTNVTNSQKGLGKGKIEVQSGTKVGLSKNISKVGLSVNDPAVVSTNVKAAEGLDEGDIVVVTGVNETPFPDLPLYEVSKGNQVWHLFEDELVKMGGKEMNKINEMVKQLGGEGMSQKMKPVARRQARVVGRQRIEAMKQKQAIKNALFALQNSQGTDGIQLALRKRLAQVDNMGDAPTIQQMVPRPNLKDWEGTATHDDVQPGEYDADADWSELTTEDVTTVDAGGSVPSGGTAAGPNTRSSRVVTPQMIRRARRLFAEDEKKDQKTDDEEPKKENDEEDTEEKKEEKEALRHYMAIRNRNRRLAEEEKKDEEKKEDSEDKSDDSDKEVKDDSEEKKDDDKKEAADSKSDVVPKKVEEETEKEARWHGCMRLAEVRSKLGMCESISAETSRLMKSGMSLESIQSQLQFADDLGEPSRKVAGREERMVPKMADRKLNRPISTTSRTVNVDDDVALMAHLYQI